LPLPLSPGSVSAMVRTETPAEPDLRTLQAQLRGAGLRSTGPRVTVLRAMQRRAAPVTHGELAAELMPEGLDRATVYRNLTDLAEAGLLTRTDLGDHVWRFELKGEADAAHGKDHMHFVCRDCGTVSCLPGDSVPMTPLAVGRVEEVLLKGLCNDCD